PIDDSGVNSSGGLDRAPSAHAGSNSTFTIWRLGGANPQIPWSRGRWGWSSWTTKYCRRSKKEGCPVDRTSMCVNNARLRDELLNGEIFYTLRGRHRELATRLQHDQTHASIGYKPPTVR